MDLGRFLVEAVIVSGASPTELARSDHRPASRGGTTATIVCSVIVELMSQPCLYVILGSSSG